jgi:hypothetical protein
MEGAERLLYTALLAVAFRMIFAKRELAIADVTSLCNNVRGAERF